MDRRLFQVGLIHSLAIKCSAFDKNLYFGKYNKMTYSIRPPGQWYSRAPLGNTIEICSFNPSQLSHGGLIPKAGLVVLITPAEVSVLSKKMNLRGESSIEMWADASRLNLRSVVSERIVSDTRRLYKVGIANIDAIEIVTSQLTSNKGMEEMTINVIYSLGGCVFICMISTILSQGSFVRLRNAASEILGSFTVVGV